MSIYITPEETKLTAEFPQELLEKLDRAESMSVLLERLNCKDNLLLVANIKLVHLYRYI